MYICNIVIYRLELGSLRLSDFSYRKRLFGRVYIFFISTEDYAREPNKCTSNNLWIREMKHFRNKPHQGETKLAYYHTFLNFIIAL